MLSSGKARNQNVIERLKEDIYQIENTERQERHNKRIELHQKAFDKHLEQVKNDLTMNSKILVMP